MFGSELPPVVDQKAYAEMTEDELREVMAQLQLQMQDPNLTNSNAVVLMEQVMFANKALQAKQDSMGQLQSYLVPYIAGAGFTYYLIKNPEVRNKNLAYLGGAGLAYVLHRLINSK